MIVPTQAGLRARRTAQLLGRENHLGQSTRLEGAAWSQPVRGSLAPPVGSAAGSVARFNGRGFARHPHRKGEKEFRVRTRVEWRAKSSRKTTCHTNSDSCRLIDLIRPPPFVKRSYNPNGVK